MNPTHRARPYVVRIEPYKPGTEDGLVAVSLANLLRGEMTIEADADGWALSTENYEVDKLREKVVWTPGLTLLPFFYYRGGRLVALPEDLIVTFAGGQRLPLNPNDMAYMYEKLPEEPTPTEHPSYAATLDERHKDLGR